MPRYIDADALLKTAYDCIPVGIVGRQERLLFAEGLINNAPTVSPDEVRGVCISNPSEGVWLPVPDKIGDCLYKCSQCGFVRDAYILDVGNYCPNCGAKMEVEGDA